MKYNTAGQQFIVAAIDADGFVSGDAANITCTLAIDGGTRSATNDTNPTEIGTSGRYAFTLTQAETAGHELAFVPLSAASGVKVVGLPSDVIYTTREAEIKAKTDLLGTGSVTVAAPVAASGEITSPLVIADDYLASQSRALIWTIDDPGFIAGTSTCKLGFSHETNGSFEVSGTITDNGSTWTLSFDIAAADSASLLPGKFDWSVHVADVNSKKSTKVRSSTLATRVEWVAALTTV